LFFDDIITTIDAYVHMHLHTCSSTYMYKTWHSASLERELHFIVPSFLIKNSLYVYASDF